MHILVSNEKKIRIYSSVHNEYTNYTRQIYNKCVNLHLSYDFDFF